MSGVKKKVAILGGGVGAMTAAYQLTRFPDWQKRFDITVYQVGWRLGGKCASGRNAAHGQRIEEHGLHVWAGFYDNAIDLMRASYDEARALGIDGLLPSFDAAFKPFNNVVLTDLFGDSWQGWNVRPPMNDEVAGTGGSALSPWDYFKMAVEMLRQLQDSSTRTTRGATCDAYPEHVRAHMASVSPDWRAPKRHIDHLHDFATHLHRDPCRHDRSHHATLAHLLECSVCEVCDCETVADDPHEHRIACIVSLVGAALRGALADNLLFEGFDAIDDHEASAWLKTHGASDASLQWSAARGVYDYAFGYSNGITDDAHRAIGAGTSLRGVSRLLSYKQSFFFEMQAGMGDTVFTPFYKVLKAGGVKFRFFHRVMGLEADAKGLGVARVRVRRQAGLVAGRDEYQPLVRVKGLDCWPSEPDYAQLADGASLREVNFESVWADGPGLDEFTLERGRDFDEVVLGIPIGALGALCSDLVAKDPRWDDMLREIKTARTLAMQLWFTETGAALGEKWGPPILSCYADPHNTWADMTHLLPVEDWPAAHAPASLGYFCGPLADDPAEPAPGTDPGYPARALAQVVADSKAWCEANLGWLLPGTQKADGTLDWARFHAPKSAHGEARFAAQYFRANIDPGERYVLSVPGSARYRLRSDESGFDNLWLAGDWTSNGLNAGCVEAATMSGMRAAAGLAGETLNIVGEHDLVAEEASSKRDRPPVARSLCAQNQAWPWSACYGVLRTSGASAVFGIARADAVALLPPELELAPQDFTGPGQHPLVMLFGWQDDVRPNLAPFGLSYREFVLAVPYVRHRDPRLQRAAPGPFSYMPRLYLDRDLPVWLGILGYGYNKKKALINATATDYTVSNPVSRKPIVAASFEQTGATGPETAYPTFSLTRQAFELPIISRHFSGWQYSFYDFSLGQARIQPASMRVKIYNDQLAGLPSGIFNLPGIEENGLGGFLLSTSATISTPFQSAELARIVRLRAMHSPPLQADTTRLRVHR